MSRNVLQTYHLYLFGLLVLVAGIPASNFLMSISQMILGLAWILEKNPIGRIRLFVKSPTAWVLASLFFLHIIGLIYTTDFGYAAKDLRTKLPLLILPFILITMPPLRKEHGYLVLWVYILTVITTGLAGIFMAWRNNVLDYREYAVGISHIRFSLNVCLALYFLILEGIRLQKWQWRIPVLILWMWLISYLLFFGARTGLVVMTSTAIVLGGIAIFRYLPVWTRYVFVVATLAISTGLFWYLTERVRQYTTAKEKPDITRFEKFTARGNPYLHDTLYFGKENGMWVGLYYCPAELPAAWAERSSLDYMGKDRKGQSLMATLVRYLNSKGLRKDRDGLSQLSDQEIRYIENGIANVEYTRFNPLKKAVDEFLFGYEQYRDENEIKGSSIMQRVELWKASYHLIRKQPVTGVGTGDIPWEFRKELDNMDSQLEGSSLRSHNQLLSIAIGFGIPGLFWFLFVLLYPIFREGKKNDFRYMAFFLIFAVSLLNEDTIESQAGVTFYAFFNAFLLFVFRDGNPGENPA